MCYIKAALEQIKIIQERGKSFHNNHHSPFLRGLTPYLIARIYAVLGEKENAVEYLQKAIDQGAMYIWWNITFDIDFVNLKGYPPFEELITPQVRE